MATAPTVKSDEKLLEIALRDFRNVYDPSFLSLITALDEAGISHYSSGCGTKSITFEIFPASAYVDEMRRMLSLDRSHKSSTERGFKDFSGHTSYDPSHDFLMYLKRWSHFAEQVMKNEGEAPRGIAAARAKLNMDDLMQRLSEGKTNGQYRSCAFSQLLRAVGLILEGRVRAEKERRKNTAQQANKYNYFKALAAANGSAPSEFSDSEVA